MAKKLTLFCICNSGEQAIDVQTINDDELNGSFYENFAPEESADHNFTDENQTKWCPEIKNNPELTGHLPQASLLIEELEENEIEQTNTDLLGGGSWKPSNCRAIYKVAIIIPYRDRKSHLNRLLDFLIPLLKKQDLDFRFIVTEQVLLCHNLFLQKDVF